MSAIKLVLMGKGGVGKTAMVVRYTSDMFDTDYNPTIGDMYTKDIEVRGAPRHLEIDDTAGQQAYESVRDEKLASGDGYMLVFDIKDDPSFAALDEIFEKIQKAQPGTSFPILLVGAKCDLDADRSVLKAEAERKAASWGAQYVECSAKEDINVAEAFEALTMRVLEETTDPTKGAGSSSVFAPGTTVDLTAKVRDDEPTGGGGGMCMIL